MEKKRPLKEGPDNIKGEGEVRKWVRLQGAPAVVVLVAGGGSVDKVGRKKENGQLQMPSNANPWNKDSMVF